MRYVISVILILTTLFCGCDTIPSIRMNADDSLLAEVETLGSNILFSYKLSVTNHSGDDMSFYIIAEMTELHDLGIVSTPLIYAEDEVGARKLFSLSAGETKSFSCLFSSDFSGEELPSDIGLPDAVMFHISD